MFLQHFLLLNEVVTENFPFNLKETQTINIYILFAPQPRRYVN